MSNEQMAIQKFLEIHQRQIDLIWENADIRKKYEGNDELRLMFKQIAFCSSVAIGYHGSGKLPVNMSMEELRDGYLDMQQKLETHSLSDDEKGLEILRLQQQLKEVRTELGQLRGGLNR